VRTLHAPIHHGGVGRGKVAAIPPPIEAIQRYTLRQVPDRGDAPTLQDGNPRIPGDPDELAVGWSRLAGDPRLGVELGANARHAPLTRHGWERNASRVVEAYRFLVADASRHQ